MPDNHHIDDMAKQHLSGHEPAFDPQDWKAMEAMLDKGKKRPIVFWWRWAGIAAVVAGIILTIAWWITIPPSEPQVANHSQPAVQEKGTTIQENQAEQTEAIEEQLTPSVLEEATALQEDAVLNEDADQIVVAPNEDNTSPEIANNSAQEKPVHWLANEVEAANENVHASQSPTSSTSYSDPNGVASPPTSASLDAIAVASPFEENGQAAPPESARTMTTSVAAGNLTPLISQQLATIPTPPTMLSSAYADGVGRQFPEGKNRFIQPFIGAYALTHRYSEMDRTLSYAYGLRGGVELWNGFSLEAGLGYHQIDYTEAGNHDTINSRVHLATEGSLHHIEVPTLITFHLNGNAKWDGYLTAGLRHLFVRKEHYHFHYRILTNPNLPVSALTMDTIITLDVTNNSQIQQEDFQQVGLAANGQERYNQGQTPNYRALGYLGAGIAYHVTPGLTVESGLQYQFSLQPFGVESRDLDAYGITLGLKYRL